MISLPYYHFQIFRNQHIYFELHHLLDESIYSRHFLCYIHDNLFLDIHLNKNILVDFRLPWLLDHKV